MICKYCQSLHIVKFGTFEGTQYYWCKDCKRKFVANDALPKMKTPAKQIVSALGMYYGGMPLDSIQRQLEQDYNIHYSESGIYNWIIRFTQDAVNKANEFKPMTGNAWIADETVLKIGGRNIWFFDVIDTKSRFLLASHMSTVRTINDVIKVMKLAEQRAGKVPKYIITDKLFSYIDGIEQAFGADTKHIQSKPFVSDNSTNLIERFHGTLKDRTKVVRGFKNMDTARLLMNGWLVHYNFFKEHSSLGNIPPAQKMGNTPFKDWTGVIKQARVMPPVSETRHLPHFNLTPVKHRHPKRKPKHLKSKTYTEVSITSMRM